MSKLSFILTYFLIFCLVKETHCWDTDELELFDIVEEVNENFYDLLGVEQGASSSDVRKAYRKLSVKLHPDKNKAPDAEEKFRQLVAVYEVLKDENKRTRYNEVLVSGLPDWRQPVYYYRHVRKLGLLELAGLLTVILTIGHGIVIWAIYIERRFELEEVFNSQRKKAKKGKKAKLQNAREAEMDDILEEELSAIPRPKWTDMLPVKMIRFNLYLLFSVPGWARELCQMLQKQKEVEEDQDEEDEEEMQRKARKRMRVDIADVTPTMAEDIAPVVYNAATRDIEEDDPELKRHGQEWTDEEVSLLVKAVARFPSGTQGRWEKIASMIGRSTNEVIAKSKEIRKGYAINVDPKAQGTTGSIKEKVAFKKGKPIEDHIISQRGDYAAADNNHQLVDKQHNKTESKQDTSSGGDSHKQKIPANKVLLVEQKGDPDAESLVWTQNQQKILEWALAQYPRGTEERWEKIAEHIPGKRKEDCVTRFKHLADVVRRRKQEAQKAS